jgi:hypothetical protein
VVFIINFKTRAAKSSLVAFVLKSILPSKAMAVFPPSDYLKKIVIVK